MTRDPGFLHTILTMEIEIISRENIKPSSPTPLHLRTFKFSLLDQIIPSYFQPVVLYFLRDSAASSDATGSLSQRTLVLKKSLSLILTRFYPFAGIIGDSFSVDCNDGGVPFAVAKVKGQLSDFLKNPDLDLVQNFLPNELSWAPPGSNVLKIQANHFDCGGMVISLTGSHVVAGGITICSFLKAWAATAAGAPTFIDAQCPNYIAQCLFPPNDKIPEESYLFSNFHPFLITGNCVLKRYVFDSSAISTLKAKSPGSRVQVITAFIWKCFMAACAAANNLPSLMVHAVDLRSRAVPPFSENCFGNFLWIATAAAESMNHTDHDQANLVTKVRESIRRIDGNFVKRMQGDEGLIGYIKNLEETKALIPGEANCLNFSSWCNFGVYDIDFGWGKPIWVANSVSTDSCNSPKLNDVMFLDTRDGKGMEVYVTIGEQYAAAFEKIEELRSLISINPSPLEFQHM